LRSDLVHRPSEGTSLRVRLVSKTCPKTVDAFSFCLVLFLCSTATEAFLRPDLEPCTAPRAGAVKDGRLATAAGGAQRP
jgi:hypothetical protein